MSIRRRTRRFLRAYQHRRMSRPRFDSVVLAVAFVSVAAGSLALVVIALA